MEFIKLNKDEYIVYFSDTRSFFKVNGVVKDILLSINNSDLDLRKKFPESAIRQCSKLLEQNKSLQTYKTQDLNKKHLKRLTLNVSGRCNLRCEYCYANAGNYQAESITFNMTKAVADQTLNVFFDYFDQIESIMFFGGEPFLNYKLIEYVCEKTLELIDQGKMEKAPHFSVITNGTVYNKKIAEIIKKYNFYVTISYDGDVNVNNILRLSDCGKGMSSTIIQNINNIINDTGIIPGIEATYTGLHVKNKVSPLQATKNIKQISDKLQVHLTPVIADDSAFYKLNDNSPFVDSVSDFFKNIRSLTDCKEHPPVYSLLGRLLFPLINKENPPVNYICNAGFGTLSVASNGFVYPCFMIIDNKNFCLGNIFDENIFYSKKFRDLQDSILRFSNKKTNEACKKCFARTVCSGCIGTCINNKQELELNKKHCDLTRSMLRETILGLYNLMNKVS